MRPTIMLAHYPDLPVFDDGDLDRLASVGHLLDRDPVHEWDEPRARELLAEAQVIVAHWGCRPIDVGLLDHAPKLGLIAYAAGTVKGVVEPEVLDRVRVTSGADANAEPVAEYTLAMILLANKGVLRPDVTPWNTGQGASQIGNWDKTVGIIGASLIGRRVLGLLRPFAGLHPVVYDPFLSADDAAALGAELVGLDELCERSDVVSLHAPNLPSTRHMIAEPQFARMRTGTTFINTARGALVDHDALVDHLDRLHAVLDVTDPEPLPDDHPLRTSPNVRLTPHIAGSLGTELHRLVDYAVDEIRRWSAGEPGRNTITRDALPRLA
ncbi:MAG: hydroxyacid dehydrogenase [Ilumatobacter fluminis]|uniref:hydroxyacid dehydrogenase n=1 Tax=Ilumatobacter fluminis TaxID=467091 RepID=UPI0032EC5204